MLYLRTPSVSHPVNFKHISHDSASKNTQLVQCQTHHHFDPNQPNYASAPRSATSANTKLQNPLYLVLKGQAGIPAKHVSKNTVSMLRHLMKSPFPQTQHEKSIRIHSVPSSLTTPQAFMSFFPRLSQYHFPPVKIYSDLGPRAPLGVPDWKPFLNRRDTSLR